MGKENKHERAVSLLTGYGKYMYKRALELGFTHEKALKKAQGAEEIAHKEKDKLL